MANYCKSDLVYGDLAITYILKIGNNTTNHQMLILVRQNPFWMFSHRGWEVVVDPDMYTAETLQVDVHNTELTLVESSRLSSSGKILVYSARRCRFILQETNFNHGTLTIYRWFSFQSWWFSIVYCRVFGRFQRVRLLTQECFWKLLMAFCNTCGALPASVADWQDLLIHQLWDGCDFRSGAMVPQFVGRIELVLDRKHHLHWDDGLCINRDPSHHQHPRCGECGCDPCNHGGGSFATQRVRAVRCRSDSHESWIFWIGLCRASVEFLWWGKLLLGRVTYSILVHLLEITGSYLYLFVWPESNPRILVAPFVHYYNTIGVHENRRFLPHLRWTIAQLSGTVGCFVLFGLIAQSYATLLAAGQSVAATLFLPFGTAFAETGMVVFTRLMYNRLVHSNKLDPETAPLVGDQLFIPAPCLIMSAHAFAEGCRLTATFSGVISGGGWGWISTSLLSVALNLSARLGWTRFMLLQLGKKICNGPKAMALFGPTGWSKYHDELKIYAGYFRFVSVIALCVARLISYGVFEVEGSKAPAFNLSALMVIICLLAAEFVEDQVVTNELLPVNPAGPGLLKMKANGDNADPAQLITLEHLHNVQQGDPWRMWDLETSGKLSLRRTTTSDSVPSKGPGEVTATPSLVVQCASTPIVPQKVVSLGSSEMDRWSRLRKWFGQPRSLNSSPALHGLRELPFAIQLSFVGIVSEFTLGLLALLVGAGYLRGTCENVLVGSDRIVGLIYWSLPLPCWRCLFRCC